MPKKDAIKLQTAMTHALPSLCKCINHFNFRLQLQVLGFKIKAWHCFVIRPRELRSTRISERKGRAGRLIARPPGRFGATSKCVI